IKSAAPPRWGPGRGKSRDHGDGEEAFEREFLSEPLPGQAEERQAEDKEAEGQTEPAGVAGQEGDPCDASGEQPCVAEHGKTQGDEQRARNECMAVVQPGVSKQLWCRL